MRWLLVILLLFPTFLHSQKKVKLECDCIQADLRLPSSAKDLKSAKQLFEKTVEKLINDGFLAASVDSIFETETAFIGKLYKGSQFKTAQLTFDGVDQAILSSSNVRQKLLENKPYNSLQLSSVLERILRTYENHGYPFARVKTQIDSIAMESIYLKVFAVPGALFEIDSIHIVSDNDINRYYVQNAIELEAGDIYNESKLQKISTRIREVPFLQEAKPAELVFKDGKVDVYLYLKEKGANNFNGILGVLPDEDGKVIFTGELQLALMNAFKGGERIRLNWRKLQSLTQELNVSFRYPFVFNLPFGVGGSFDLYKRDTTYLELEPSIEVFYQMGRGNTISGYFSNYQSRLLNPDLFSNASKLPAFNDTRRRTFGVKVDISSLDYRINPRSGVSLELDASAGTKEISILPELDEEIYSNIQVNTSQYELEGKANYFIPLLKRATLMVGSKFYWLITENIFINEMKRIGGLHTLRGFDDQSIFASAYGIGVAEFRYLLEQNSHVFAFFEHGYIENKSSDGLTISLPMSFGAGIAFQTKPGIFSINYALGRMNNDPFLVRSAKIHFGFVSYF